MARVERALCAWLGMGEHFQKGGHRNMGGPAGIVSLGGCSHTAIVKKTLSLRGKS